MHEEQQPSSDDRSNESNTGSNNVNSGTPTAQTSQTEPDFRCAYCSKYFVRAESKTLPFCSKRCQQIDLGMWLNESYSMPYEGDESDGHVPREYREDDDEV